MRSTALVVVCATALALVSNASCGNSVRVLGLHELLKSEEASSLIIPEELVIKVTKEDEEWHMTPWRRTRLSRNETAVFEDECVPGNSADSFPDGILTDEQLRQGGFLIYVFFGVYAFILLALVCNDYFIPCVELICEDLKIPEDVAAATFMAVATSCPEFFVNTISTFVSESDMGIGAIIGSALFNALGVAAVGSLAAIRPIKLSGRPVTRDVLIYLFNVSILVAIVWDGVVKWYEATALACLYVIYFILMFNSVRLFKKFDDCMGKNNEDEDEKDTGKDNAAFDAAPEIQINGAKESVKGVNVAELPEEEVINPFKAVFQFPREAGIWGQIWWLFIWPLKFLMTFTIPSPTAYRNWYPLAFFMCICWIGGNSYIVSWMMTVIGTTFLIPDSIMGMTFLAFGGCMPEACSIFIMSRKGLGGIGVSNALGANTLAILFALGVPWFIRCMALLIEGNEADIIINSTGIEFIIISLFLAVCSLWIVLRVGQFTLKKSIGFILAALYLVFITFAILVEMGIILSDGTPRCF